MSAQLTAAQRQAVEAALLPALRARFPGRAVRIEWDQPDALGDGQPPRPDRDGVEDAA